MLFGTFVLIGFDRGTKQLIFFELMHPVAILKVSIGRYLRCILFVADATVFEKNEKPCSKIAKE